MSKEMKSILHVDDELDALKVVKVILEKEGYKVTSANSGKDALKLAGEEKFDLFILDIMMPDMTGWELFQAITELDSSYRVIFLTVLGIPDEKLDALHNQGLRDYIHKPFNRVDLLGSVKQALGDNEQ